MKVSIILSIFLYLTSYSANILAKTHDKDGYPIKSDSEVAIAVQQALRTSRSDLIGNKNDPSYCEVPPSHEKVFFYDQNGRVPIEAFLLCVKDECEILDSGIIGGDFCSEFLYLRSLSDIGRWGRRTVAPQPIGAEEAKLLSQCITMESQRNTGEPNCSTSRSVRREVTTRCQKHLYKCKYR